MFKATFVLEKETKGTFRYKEVVPKDSPTKVGTLYVKKATFGGATAPNKLEVEVKSGT
jgi:hypothetical protein